MSFLPESDREYLEDKKILYRETTSGGMNGLIFPEWSIPKGKYNLDQVQLLIQIPVGYKTTPPDMFYLYPAVTFAGTSVQPQATEARVNFDNKSWQRWSRHFITSTWRPEVDGIHTYLQKVKRAMEEGNPK
jgi:hypothetical protein